MRMKWIKGCAASSLVLVSAGTGATNAEFQDFFFLVCNAPGGALATRCAETPGGLGNLSGDSESSLNPSQALGHNRALVDSAQSRREAQPSGQPGARVDIGPYSLLVNVSGNWFEHDAGSTPVAERALDGDALGVEFGLDYRLSERAVLGALLGLERSDYQFLAESPGTNFVPQSRSGDGESEEIHLTLFGSFAIGDAGYLDLSGGFGRLDGTYRRYSVFQESTRTLPQVNTEMTGDTDGTTTWLGLSGGWDFGTGALGFGVFGGLNWAKAKLDGYSEVDASASGLAMSFSATQRKSLLGSAGLRASYTLSGSSGVFIPQLRVEYQREFESDPQSVVARFLLDDGDNSFALVGDDPDKSAIEAGLSLSAVMPGGWNLFADYALLFASDDLERNRITLGLRKEF